MDMGLCSRRDVGRSKSRRESARIIAEGSGETPKAVEHKIERGEKELLPHHGAPEKNPTKPAGKADLEKLEKPKHGNPPKRGGKKHGLPNLEPKM
jgi:hypothetical protein